jgi:hypothetical protein
MTLVPTAVAARFDQVEPGDGDSRESSRQEPARPAGIHLPNLIISLRVSVTFLVRTAGPPPVRCQAAYCSL